MTKNLEIVNGIDENLKLVRDADGTDTPLELSKDKLRITGDLNVSNDIDVKGIVNIGENLFAKNSLFIEETASAETDEVNFGQIWVKNEDPNQLYFTNDDGNDIQITYKDHLAPTEQIRLQVRNDEGSTIAAGSPLYSKGEIGGSERILVGVCDANDASKMPCIGIAFEEMNTSSTKDNYAVVNGGDNLYIQTDGSLSQDKPTATDELIQNIGIVLRTNGSICQGLLVSAIGRTNDVPNTNERPLCIKETADAVADAAGYGQLWVHDDSPNNLYFTDDTGQDVQITNNGSLAETQYYYDIKYIGYNANSVTYAYLPINGYIFEQTSTLSRNEYHSFIAPYNGTIHQLQWRTEEAVNANTSFRILESSDGTEIPGSVSYRKDIAVDIADDTTYNFDLSSPTTGSTALVKGRIYVLYYNFGVDTNDTNFTVVFKWDLTT